MSLLGRIGLFDRRVALQSVSTTKDGAGQEVETWGTVATIWAREIPQKGGERFIAQQVVGRAVLTMRIRYRSDVTVDDHRIRFRDRDWDILDVRVIGRNEGLELDLSARSEG